MPAGARALLLDVEGTTTPVSFVFDVLFPFARERLEEACARSSSDPEIAQAVERLRLEHADESSRGAPDLPEFGNGAPYAAYLMDRDRKSTGLKQLQGLIWREGYADDSLHGLVFPDVAEALERLKRAGVRLRIFSSGSILAQKLLFAHTEQGDLTPFFEAHHDTTTGPKKDPRAYRRIAEAFGLPPGEILFLSDVVEELDAAREAGMLTGLSVRPGNKPVGSSTHPVYRNFAELL